MRYDSTHFQFPFAAPERVTVRQTPATDRSGTVTT
jgi:hypothetical protein